MLDVGMAHPSSGPAPLVGGTLTRLLGVVAACGWLVACGDDGSDAPRDLGVADARVDAGVDAGADGSIEAGDDASVLEMGAPDLGAIDMGPAPLRPLAPEEVAIPWLEGAPDPAMARPELEPVAAPRFVCPAGWTSVAATGDDPAVCEPWPATGRATCDDGEAHLPGTPGCAPIGDACPSGEWPAVAAGETVRYVRPGAGGTGTIEAPFGSVAEVVAAGLMPGLVIALSRGMHTEVFLPEGATEVVLRGACAADTVITTADGQAGIRVNASRVVIEGVSIEGGRQGIVVETARSATVRAVHVRDVTDEAIVVRSGASLDADGVRIDGAGTDAIAASSGATVTVRNAEIGDFAARAPISRAALRCSGVGATCSLEDVSVHDGANDGVAFVDGSTGGLRRVVVEDTVSSGIFVPSSELSLTDVVVRRVRKRDAAGTAIGVSYLSLGSGDLVRLRVEDVADVAIRIATDARVQAEDIVVRDGVAGGLPVAGISVVEFGRLTLDRVAVLRARGAALVSGGMAIVSGGDIALVGDADDGAGAAAAPSGMLADGGTFTLDRVSVRDVRGPALRAESGARVTIDGVVLRGSRGSAAPSAGVVSGGGMVTLRNGIVEGNEGPAIALAAGADPRMTSIALTDVAVAGGDEAGEGARVESGRLTATRATWIGFAGRAIRVSSVGAEATLSDVLVSGVAPSIDGDAVALEVDDQARLAATRVEVRDVSGHAIVARGTRTSATLESVSVIGPIEGYGLVAVDGATLEIDRAFVRSATGLGAGAFGLRGSLDAQGLEVQRTAASPGGVAVGIGAFDGATTTVEGFATGMSAQCGVQVDGTGTTLDVVDGYVESNPVGACLGPDFAESHVRDRVLYVRNALEIDRELHAPPSAP